MRILLPIILILMLSSCSVQPETIYIEVPKEVIREVTVVREIEVVRVVEVDRELKDFASAEEFREVISRYIDGLTVLNGDCVELARFLVEVLGNNGYYIDTEVVGKHMIIKGFITNQAICYYDPRSNRFSYVYKDSTYQNLETYTFTFPPPSDDEPNWGKGGKPKPDKPDKPKK